MNLYLTNNMNSQSEIRPRPSAFTRPRSKNTESNNKEASNDSKIQEMIERLHSEDADTSRQAHFHECFKQDCPLTHQSSNSSRIGKGASPLTALERVSSLQRSLRRSNQSSSRKCSGCDSSDNDRMNSSRSRKWAVKSKEKRGRGRPSQPRTVMNEVIIGMNKRQTPSPIIDHLTKTDHKANDSPPAYATIVASKM